MTLKEKIIKKYGSVYAFVKASGANQNRVYYLLNNGMTPKEEGVMRALIDSIDKPKKEEITEALRTRIIIAIRAQYKFRNVFCQAHDIREKNLSEILNGKVTRITRNVRRICEALNIKL